VLIVDDSEFFRNLVRSYLEQAGFPVVEAVDGLDAWQVLETDHETIGLVVTDIEMPKMDGLTLTRRVKEDEKLRRLPVIVFSSIMADDIKRKAVSIGADAQITKPEIDILVETVCKLLVQQ
jgi:CheY-like chemotaxis protein